MGLRAEMEENGRLCRFIFHRGEIISEETGSESGGYLSSQYIRGNGVEYLEQDGTAYSFQKDEQGSTVFLLDREKEIAGVYAYDGFGNLRKNAGFGKHGNRMVLELFTTEEIRCQCHNEGHFTLFPTEDMTVNDFNGLYRSIVETTPSGRNPKKK